MVKRINAIWFVMLGLVCSLAGYASSDTSSTKNSNMRLYPYLGANGQYGFADSNMQVVIRPQYRSVNFFTEQGIAIVRNSEDKYGIIDLDGRLILPFRKDNFRLFTVGDQTLIELSSKYKSNLRFWNWQFWPGFSLTGGGNDKRWFDTNVPREKVQVRWLEKDRTIRSKRGAAQDSRLRAKVTVFDERTFLLDDELYRLDEKKAVKIASKISKTVNYPLFLQKVNNEFKLMKLGEELVLEKMLQVLPEMDLLIAEQDYRFQIQMRTDYQVYSKGDFYKAGNGQVYVFPDFDKPFPTKISDQTTSDSLSADEILDRARYIQPIPNTDRFMIVLGDLKTLIALDTEGNWHPADEHKHDFRIVTPSGGILWPLSADFLDKSNVVDDWEVNRISEIHTQSELYTVTLRRDKEQRQGIWDNTAKSWKLYPKFHSIRNLDFDNRFVPFLSHKEGKWGLYDLEKQEIYIAEIYHSIYSNGMVQLFENGKYISFYLDVTTKREFREKPVFLPER